jgi:protein involved in polysaccharide export with SLBB domain
MALQKEREAAFMKFLLVSLVWIVPYFAQNRPDYLLAPNDRIFIRAPGAGAMNGQIFQIQRDGFVTFPSVGRTRAAGLTIRFLEKQLAGWLTQSTTGEGNLVITVVSCSPSNPDCMSSLPPAVEPNRTPSKSQSR